MQMNLFWSFPLKLFYSLSLSETQAVLLAQLELFSLSLNLFYSLLSSYSPLSFLVHLVLVVILDSL